jgi:trehalose-phosphatase
MAENVTNMVRKSALEKILREMQELRYRLDDIEQSISRWKPNSMKISESELLLLPEHLRKTYMTVLSKGECNATQVSNLTGRCRAVESNYLNQLVRTGWMARKRNSKEIHFVALRNGSAKKIKPNNYLFKNGPVKKEKEFHVTQEKEGRTTRWRMKVDCLSFDYDGTISPITSTRKESHVPMDTRVMLREISRLVPTSIITMKDLSFVTPRTPFAHAWSGIGGLEMQIGRKVVKRQNLESSLPNVSLALNYAKSQITAAGVEIEEKTDSEGRTIAFCVDYRRAKDVEAARLNVEQVASYCETLELKVLRYGKQPFFDVYPCAPNKGQALKETLNELKVKKGVLYLGDSETDNSAFNVSSLSVGVVHDETRLDGLNCDFLVSFENVPCFLKALINNNLQFRDDFPMIKKNPNGMKGNKTEAL